MSDRNNFSALCIAIEANVPVLWWGAPGIGKTSKMLAYARATGRRVEVLIASLREPTDFLGLQVRDGNRSHTLPPDWAVELAENGPALLLFDELSSSPPLNQAAVLRIIQERHVGRLRLPDYVRPVAIANPADQAAGGWDLSLPLANRFVHIESSADAGAYVTGMLGGWPDPEPLRLPDAWQTGIPAQRALVAAFIRARPQLLLVIPKDAAQGSRGWPSPRSWDTLATTRAAALSAQAPEDVLIPLAAGCVGQGAALEVLAWVKEQDLPDPEFLLAHPSKFRLPERGDTAFAVLASVTAAALQNLTPERWDAVWEIVTRCCKAGAKDIAARAAIALSAERSRLPNYRLPAEALAELRPIIEALK